MGYKSLTDGIQYRDREFVALASAERTATTTSADFTNPDGKGAHFILVVSALTSGAQLNFAIQGKDPATGNYYTLLTGTNVTATGTTLYKIGAGLPSTANNIVNDFLPQTFRIAVSHADTKACTYSVGAVING